MLQGHPQFNGASERVLRRAPEFHIRRCEILESTHVSGIEVPLTLKFELEVEGKSAPLRVRVSSLLAEHQLNSSRPPYDLPYQLVILDEVTARFSVQVDYSRNGLVDRAANLDYVRKPKAEFGELVRRLVGRFEGMCWSVADWESYAGPMKPTAPSPASKTPSPKSTAAEEFGGNLPHFDRNAQFMQLGQEQLELARAIKRENNPGLTSLRQAEGALSASREILRSVGGDAPSAILLKRQELLYQACFGLGFNMLRQGEHLRDDVFSFAAAVRKLERSLDYFKESLQYRPDGPASIEPHGGIVRSAVALTDLLLVQATRFGGGLINGRGAHLYERALDYYFESIRSRYAISLVPGCDRNASVARLDEDVRNISRTLAQLQEDSQQCTFKAGVCKGIYGLWKGRHQDAIDLKRLVVRFAEVPGMGHVLHSLGTRGHQWDAHAAPLFVADRLVSLFGGTDHCTVAAFVSHWQRERGSGFDPQAEIDIVLRIRDRENKARLAPGYYFVEVKNGTQAGRDRDWIDQNDMKKFKQQIDRQLALIEHTRSRGYGVNGMMLALCGLNMEEHLTLVPRVLKNIPDVTMRVNTRASSGEGIAPEFPSSLQIERWTKERRDLKAVLDAGPAELRPKS